MSLDDQLGEAQRGSLIEQIAALEHLAEEWARLRPAGNAVQRNVASRVQQAVLEKTPEALAPVVVQGPMELKRRAEEAKIQAENAEAARQLGAASKEFLELRNAVIERLLEFCKSDAGVIGASPKEKLVGDL